MNASWYKRIFPTVGEIKTALPSLSEKLLKIPTVTAARLWGSVVSNMRCPSIHVRDLDIIVNSLIPSEDLLSITGEVGDDLFSLSPDALEDEGYNPDAVTFTSKYASISDFNLDHWCISSDRVLMHFGPITNDQSEWGTIWTKAEKYASDITKTQRSELRKSSKGQRAEWYWNFKKFVDMQLDDMPGGWYASRTPVDDILPGTLLIASQGT